MNTDASRFLIRRVAIFDGSNPTLQEDMDVLIEDEQIVEASSSRIRAPGAHVIELPGHTLMPGLIDGHVHVYAADVSLTRNMQRPWTYLAHHAARFLRTALQNGFTTVRDMGGADFGLAMSLRDGLLEGPRLYYCGRILSQTGGHADWRAVDEDQGSGHCCSCGFHDQKLSVIVDGKDAVTGAAREELRRGATHLKILASGGVASPSDAVDNLQFSDEEISAVVEEAQRHAVYVAAHCHPSEAIRRCVRLGVRTIEHATLIDPATARLLAESEAYAVPTVAVLHALATDGQSFGLSARSAGKARQILGSALEGLEHMRRAGVRVGFGTDFLGPQQAKQLEEFTLRREVFSAFEILRSATSVNAEILGAADKLGCVAPGAYADLIAVRGNPLEDIGLLAAGGRNLSLIMKAGKVHRLERN